MSDKVMESSYNLSLIVAYVERPIYENGNRAFIGTSLKGGIVEFIFGLLVVVVAVWMWKSRQYDKQTTLNFSDWLLIYEASVSPSQRSRMAVALLAQSLHLARAMGAINDRQRNVMASVLKQQMASLTLTLWLSVMLPAVISVVGKQEADKSPARFIGMLMLLVWMADPSEREDAIRGFLFSLTNERDLRFE